MLPLLLFTLLGFASQASAATWYFLRYYTPSGAKFTSFSGDMVIPPLPQAGTYYLWPGLQPTDNSGVYQNVLDGRSGTWWIGSGWYAFPDKSFNQVLFAIELTGVSWDFGQLAFKNVKIVSHSSPFLPNGKNMTD
ncbi:hypothetical protein KJ359_007613 [Pestalotiopsis sp. 9143b]|nr:hypothetical protein KJ359_007613 [Pestalotiopsis sp. 9143b]